MATQTVTVELADSVYESLRQKVDAGKYASFSEGIETALLDFEPPFESIPPANGQSYEEWIHAGATAAYDQHQASPTNVFTSEEVLAWLGAQRGSQPEATH